MVLRRGIARGLWPDSSPSDSKGKKPLLDRDQGTSAPSSTSDRGPPDIIRQLDRLLELLSAITPCAGSTCTETDAAVFPIGMPLSRSFQKLMEGGLLTALTPRPPTQPLPPQFRMDLHCAYHQGPGHDTDRCSALRHAIQDLIDQGRCHTHVELGDGLPEMIVPDDGYEIWEDSPGCTSVTRPFDGTDSREEVRREDDEILRQLQSTQARISIWSLLATSSIHRDALIRALSQIRVETSTTPEGLIHMMTAIGPLALPQSPIRLVGQCSALNVCPLATAIASALHPQIWSLHTDSFEDSCFLNLLLGRPWIHQAGAIPSSLHQKVKFIHDGQTLEIQDFCRDFVAMSFDQHSSTLVLDMMRGMSFLPGFGLGRRQHGSSEFVTSIDHETPYGLGFTPSEDDVCYMARLRRDRVRARLSGIPFDYPVRPYTFSLADYFVRGSEVQPRVEEIGVDDSTLGELQHVFHQMQLGDETPDMSASAMILPPSPDRASLFSLCFPDEITDYGVIIEPEDMTDGVVPRDEYHDEMDMLGISQFLDTVQREPFSPLELFGVSVIEIAEEDQTVPAPELSAFVIPTVDMYEGTVGPIEGASDSVDPPLSFDILSGFVTRFDCVSDDSVMDLSIYEYSSVSCDDVSLFAPYPLTSQIFDINDEIAQPDSDDQPRELKIGLPLSTDERNRLIHLLRSYLDVFAWSYEDMPGLDPSIVQHHLPILPHARPVKQKLRRLHPRWSLQVKEEIQKQLSVGFISVVEYPEWLSNVVPVPKKDGKVRVCVDFRDLNKASPKDDFPLPHIDLLVDGTTGHSMLSFMDGVMPFGLKNAGATYQRAATALFHDMMHRDVEVLRLNPKKCTFGVTSGKLLGHMVSERGIEVDPDKIKAILDMPVPRTEKEIRGFLGRLQYISRFIARLTDICEPIFRLLRKNQPTVWNDDCQLAFERIKEYLLSPPVLVPPMPGRPLLLYLSVSDMALGCMLAQLDDSGKERAIYYLSKRMLEYEMRYVMIERFCLALVWATRRLRHYMTEYSVHLISRLDPLRYLFDRPALAGRLMRWEALLRIHLASLPIIESRPIDDDFPDEEFVAMTRLSGWRMYFDGAANHSGYGIGVLLVSPQGDHIPRSVRLTFPNYHPTTNNIVEYEACILGLETALELGITQMDVLGDSNLVLRQVQGDWKTRDVKLKPYHAYLELLIEKFEELKYIHLPRAHNQFADALATLASTVDIPTNVVVRPLLIETRSAPAYCHLIDETEVQDDLPWFHDIRQFLRFGTYPEATTAKIGER
ncbi:Retrovirus-related Pol polyprotein from transposon 17.6 [Vitis vinifera]|uniref:Retrovirus-related Pol polyprotein from transposon 17.6 n=1 Tax=Vitis vinifera TaxID=29760 RepID=A0A438DYF2_VITVI|nr:Retrovirus-related Pol polyprotein from transposon 17.6 [Vitis vinifera]